jgi:penicillin-binding protein 1C
MGGQQNRETPEYGFLLLFLTFLITPLFLFKWIGDIILFIFHLLIRFLPVPYKLGYFAASAFQRKIRWIARILKRALQGGFHKRFIRYPQPQSNAYQTVLKNSMKKRSILFHRPHKLIIVWNALVIRVKYFSFGAFAILSIVGTMGTVRFVQNLPNPTILSTRDTNATTKILDRNGTLLYEIYAQENRTPIPLSTIPKTVIDATVAIEDKEFFLHRGFSFRGIMRALYRNITSHTLEGGSTITQQLVRSAFLTPERTAPRKIKELILAIWTEQLYSKEQILEMYLNEVPYGSTSWGIEAASQTYFGKSASYLTLPEAALLAGLPAAPSEYSPFSAEESVYRARQKEVLRRMQEDGYISNTEYVDAINAPLSLRKPRIPIAAPHFVMYVREYLEKLFGPRLVTTGGLRVVTTLDLPLNDEVQQTITSHIDGLHPLNVGNGAALITNPSNGQILAMIGSTDYFDASRGGNVNVTTSLRQPGSSIKVVTYATALSEGLTTTSLISDSPIVFRVPGTSPYAPVNYDGRYHGVVTLRTALGSSYNIPAVKLLNQVGIEKMVTLGKAMGIENWSDPSRYGLSITLGAAEVSMLDLARVYGTLAAMGSTQELTPIISVTDSHGKVLPLPSRKEHQTVSAAVAFLLSSILSDNTARTPAFGPHSSLVIQGHDVAVKTGTSDNKRDNWTIGYTPEYLVATWVGNNDGSLMHPSLTSGITGAAPIWHDIMTKLLENKPNSPFPIPNDIVSISCNGKLEYYLRGTEKSGCPLFKRLSIIPTPTQKR